VISFGHMNFNCLVVFNERHEFLTAMKIQVVVFWIVTWCTDVVGYKDFTLKMGATRSSETTVSYHITIPHYNSEDRDMSLFYHRPGIFLLIARYKRDM